MIQMNMLPLNVEAVLAEDWVFEYVHSYRNSADIIDVMGVYIDRDSSGRINYDAKAMVNIPAGTKFLIRKYDLNQGAINGLITVTIRILDRSPKVKVGIDEINKIKYVMP